MGHTHDQAPGCPPGCFRQTGYRLYGVPEGAAFDGPFGARQAEVDAGGWGILKPIIDDDWFALRTRVDLVDAGGVSNGPWPVTVDGRSDDPGADPPLTDGCGNVVEFPFGTLTVTDHVGPGNPWWYRESPNASPGEPWDTPWRWIDDPSRNDLTPTGPDYPKTPRPGDPATSAGFNGASHQVFTFDFPCAVDFAVVPMSMQGNDEWLRLDDGADEGYGYPQLILVPNPADRATTTQGYEDIPPGTFYEDRTTGPSIVIFRQRQQVQLTWHGGRNLTSMLQFFVLLAPDGIVPQPCQGASIELREPCAPDTTPRWRNGCAETDPLGDVFSDFTAADQTGWEYSSDAGATWVPAPASAPHAAGDPAGQHRWRQTFTLPPGHVGFWFVQMRGGNDNIHGEVRYNGTLMDDGFKHGVPYFNPDNGIVVAGGWSSPYQEYEDGVHTFEWWEGEHDTAGVTTPEMYGKFAAVLPIRDDIVIIECLDKADGSVQSTRYETPEGVAYTLLPNATASAELCEGCR